MSPFRIQCCPAHNLWKRGESGVTLVSIFCSSLRVKLFSHKMYCAKLSPGSESQSGSWYRRGLGRWDPRIMRDYDLVTVVAISQLTHPHTCEMGSSIFSAMSRLKLVSTERGSFPCIPSTERKNVEKFPLLMAVLTMLILIFHLQMSSKIPNKANLNVSLGLI